jgi:Rieske Fe-S protein
MSDTQTPISTAVSPAITLSLPVTRRRFCAGACQAASGATVATLFTSCGGGSSSPTSPSSMPSTLGVSKGQFAGNSVRVTVSGSALTDVGGAVLVESTAGVFLVSRTSATAFQAIDAVCSHQSCTVTNADRDEYVCPCHGSRYSRTGRVLAGPAQASLRQFASTFADGVLTITL